jgi:hypothetical protein
MTSHFLCYQGLAVDDYGFALDAADMGHPRLSLGVVHSMKSVNKTIGIGLVFYPLRIKRIAASFRLTLNKGQTETCPLSYGHASTIW